MTNVTGEFGEKIPAVPGQDGGAVFKVVQFSPEGPWLEKVGGQARTDPGPGWTISYTRPYRLTSQIFLQIHIRYGHMLLRCPIG